MKKPNYSISIFLICLSLVLFSCGSDDNDDDNDDPIFEAVINGEKWSYEEIEESSILNIDQTNEQNMIIKGISGNIKLAVSMYDENSPLGNCVPLDEYNFISVAILYENNGNFFDSHSSNSNDNITNVIVNKCEEGKISGTFNASLTGGIIGVSPEQVEITNGVFENIAFEILSL